VFIRVGAIDTANSFLRTQYRATTGTLIKDDSGISWHLLRLRKSTLRTGNHDIEFNFHNLQFTLERRSAMTEFSITLDPFARQPMRKGIGD
jgi:hypothetical protein